MLARTLCLNIRRNLTDDDDDGDDDDDDDKDGVLAISFDDYENGRPY